MIKMGSRTEKLDDMATLANRVSGNLDILSRCLARRFDAMGGEQSGLRLSGLTFDAAITVDPVIFSDSIVSLLSCGLAY